MEELRIMSPQGMLGYGYPNASLALGLEKKPHMIGVDSGSTDAGPYRLGSGKPTVPRETVKRDLSLMLEGALKLDIPLIVGSAGGAGAKEHVEWVWDILEEVAKEKALSFRAAIIWSDVEKRWLLEKLENGLVKPLGPISPLESEDVEKTSHVVAVMGVAPYMEALERGAQIIIAGRSNDPAIFASFALWKGFDSGLSFHLGKILECGAMASVPGSASDGMLGRLRRDHFVVEPLNPERRCTELSVAAHTLYEKSDPLRIPGPEGELDLAGTCFRQYDSRSVEVRGSIFKPAQDCWIKLEGAGMEAYRSIFIAGIRDPIMIERMEEWQRATRDELAGYFHSVGWRILFRLYGYNGVMGKLEPTKETASHEIGLIFEAIAPSQEEAQNICSFARSFLMHYHYQGRKATAGNLALPYSPADIPMGPTYNFTIHHLVKVNHPVEPFRIEQRQVGF
jgi:hypothetical protein